MLFYDSGLFWLIICALTISAGILQMGVLINRLLLPVLNPGQKWGILKNTAVKIPEVICRCLLCQTHDVENDHDLIVFIWLCHWYNDLANHWTGYLTGKDQQIGKNQGSSEVFWKNLPRFLLICSFLACWKDAPEARLKPYLPWEV